MRVVITIPHYVGAAGALRRRHGSTAQRSAEKRAAGRGSKLRAAILALHQTFGSRQFLMQLDQRRTAAANASMRVDLHVILCSLADQHAVQQAALPQALYQHHLVDESPEWLGYACHEVLAQHVDEADWLGYLEDDLLIRDPLWWLKLNWFIETAGIDAVLQPNRFERAVGTLAHRAYIDGRLKEATAGRFQQRRDRPEICAQALGRSWRFIRPSNPHSGCFFLRRDQMRQWISRPSFLDRSGEFVGPLESAASLGLMRTFRVYKPARENAGFLEIEHQSRQFISQLRRE